MEEVRIVPTGVRINPVKRKHTNEDEEQEDWMQKRQALLFFCLSKFEPAVCEQVEQGCGFRLRT